MPASPRDDNRSVAIGAKSDISNAFVPLECNPVTKALKVETQTIDVEIGAVEIKNSTDDTRATVGANGLHVDVQASALPTGAATSAKQLADDHNVTVSNMIPAVETGLATSALQLADGHAVTIDNISTNEVFIRGSQSAGSAVDGEVVTVQGIAGATAIAVTESSPLTGFATSAGQLADGHNVTIDNIISNEVYVRGSGTAGTADAAVLTIQGIASMTALSVTESTPLTGFATSAGQLSDGHNVTIDNAASAAAVNIQDGGNTITVDGTVAVTGTFWQETQPISGTVTANLSATDNTVLDSIDTGLDTLNSLVPAVYDYIDLSYTGSDLTGVVFKTGGSGGSTVSTLTLAYTSNVLQSVTKT